jgi:hypothetical protein
MDEVKLSSRRVADRVSLFKKADFTANSVQTCFSGVTTDSRAVSLPGLSAVLFVKLYFIICY